MDNRLILLQHALPLVPFDGWSAYTLRMAAQKAGLPESAVAHAFPGGVGDCVNYFFTEADETLARAFPEGSLATFKIPQRIETLMLAKLDRWLPHREAVRLAVAWRALPWNIASTTASLYRSVDIMWRLAGDTSTDFSFYTKRATLAALHSSTLLFWLNDTSESNLETKQFLKRRLGNIADFGRWKKEFTAKFRRT